MKNYGKLVGAIVAAWFGTATVASMRHVFTNTSGRFGAAVAVASAAPILAFVAWYLADRGFRRFTRSLDADVLTTLQSWRVLGLMFVVLATYRILPAIFALPAGYGDMVVGATAVLAAMKLANPAGRNRFIAWQLLGIADLITAVGLGTTAPLINPKGIPMAPMTALPLSLIPTFLVPLFLILHLICIAQARQWKSEAALTRSRELRSAYAK